ncbi:MAG TPA: glutaredoxin family protein [Polyangiaceae bacterium]|nr:glutaredoxin family protein [Polyangiaceae bacterium]
MKRIVFYTRDDCHLCSDALSELARVRSEIPFELDVVDLDREASPEKRALYDWEVPVVELDGRKIMKYRVDADRLRRLLQF